MEARWVEPQRVMLLESQWTSLRFELHQRYCELNGNKVYLGQPIALNSRQLHISETDYELSLLPLLAPHTFDPKPKLYRIVIDPGHGGRDPGALNEALGVNEKDTTLDIARRLRDKLEAYGYKVYLTRESDRYVPLEDRPAVANRVHADLFLSLHFNAVDTPSVHGVECYVMTLAGHPSTNSSRLTASARRTYPGNENDPWNALAGQALHNALLEHLSTEDRGLRRARFKVLTLAECPAVLVEGGFVSNPTEGARIGTPQYRELIAHALLQGILNYQKTLNRIRGR